MRFYRCFSELHFNSSINSIFDQTFKICLSTLKVPLAAVSSQMMMPQSQTLTQVQLNQSQINSLRQQQQQQQLRQQLLLQKQQQAV